MSNTKQIFLPNLDSDDDFERVCAILTPDQGIVDKEEGFEPPEVTPQYLELYQTFLLSRLSAGLKLTGQEDLGYFAWEEQFIWGTASSKEYKAMKQQLASFQDKLVFVSLMQWDEASGLLAKVRRIKDQKIFEIPLADLEVCDSKAIESQLIEDYAMWFTTFGEQGC